MDSDFDQLPSAASKFLFQEGELNDIFEYFLTS